MRIINFQKGLLSISPASTFGFGRTPRNNDSSLVRVNRLDGVQIAFRMDENASDEDKNRTAFSTRRDFLFKLNFFYNKFLNIYIFSALTQCILALTELASTTRRFLLGSSVGFADLFIYKDEEKNAI